MCQQQFEAEVMAEQYEWACNMAKAIAEICLDCARRWPLSTMNEWYEGRVRAAALIVPCVETLSARNEFIFLTGDYAKRHRRNLV